MRHLLMRLSGWWTSQTDADKKPRRRRPSGVLRAGYSIRIPALYAGLPRQQGNHPRIVLFGFTRHDGTSADTSGSTCARMKLVARRGSSAYVGTQLCMRESAKKEAAKRGGLAITRALIG